MLTRLAARVPLTRDEVHFLQSASDRTVHFRRHDLIQVDGDPADQAFFLERGWAMTFSDFSEGSRQARRLHFPGDILGLPSMAMKHHPASIEALTDVVAAPFGKRMISELVSCYPRLAGIMFIFAQEERITMGDRLCALSHLPCKGRLAFLMMDIATRLRASDPSIKKTFELHLTRAQMADIMGMSSVHASRVWCELVSDGAIKSDGPFVTLRDEDRLQQLSGYVDRSVDLDFGWLPSTGLCARSVEN